MVEVFDIKQDQELGVYYVMEYWGTDLSRTINAPPDVRWAMSCTKQLLQGISELHRNQFAHRDIKPANIFIKNNHIKLGDYGLVKSKRYITRYTTFAGTPYYMAPEIEKGQLYDHRCDIYSVGVILRQYLIWQPPPFNSDEKPSHLSDNYWDIVLKAMSDVPDQRFQTAKEFLDELNSLPHLDAKNDAEIVSVEKEDTSVKHTKTVDAQPKDALAYLRRGKIYLERKEYQDALEDFNRAILLNPNLSRAYACRGEVHQIFQDVGKAIDDYNRAISLDSTFAQAYYNRGTLYHQITKNYSKALTDYNKTISLNSEYIAAYNSRGLVHMELKNYDAALADFNKALQINPEYALAYSNRGKIYQESKEYLKALSDYERAITFISPDALSSILERRADIYIRLEKFNEALKDVEQIIKLNPSDIRPVHLKVNMLEAKIRYYQAIRGNLMAVRAWAIMSLISICTASGLLLIKSFGDVSIWVFIVLAFGAFWLLIAIISVADIYKK